MSLAKQQAKLSLYHFQGCPFCRYARSAISLLEVDVDLRDILNQPDYRRELVQGGGKPQVPCLKIEQNGKTRWLYESRDIIAYLNQSTDGIKKTA